MYNFDYIELFHGSFSEYSENCITHGPGPFCRAATSTEKIQNLTSAIQSGDLNSHKFGSLIFGVSQDNFGKVSDIHYETPFSGGLFASNEPLGATKEPQYLDQMVEIFKNQNNENCGCQDIDECALRTDSCGENSVCSNIIRSFECICEEGYNKEDGSSQCTDIDECQDTSACPTLASCANTIGSFDCNCNAGYELQVISDIMTCEDINECTENTHDCFADENCENLDGSFNCTEKDSLEHDECAIGTHICPAHSTCTNTYFRVSPTGYQCDCNEGFECKDCFSLMALEDFKCSDIDECARNSSSCNLNTATCVNTIGSYECQCEGWEQSDGQGNFFNYIT